MLDFVDLKERCLEVLFETKDGLLHKADPYTYLYLHTYLLINFCMLLYRNPINLSWINLFCHIVILKLLQTSEGKLMAGGMRVGDVRGGAVELDLRIGGMSCTACAARIERAVGRLEGVSGISVHYAARSANIRYAPDVVTTSGIVDAIGKLGFQASPLGGSDNSAHNEIGSLLARFVLSALLTLPLLWAMAHHYTWLRGVPVPLLLQEPLLQFGLAAIVQFFIGKPFYFRAYYALRERSANMDVLIAIGTSAAFGYSYYAMMAGMPLYFETSAVVISAVLLGKLLETAASERVMRENDGYAAMQAREAVVVRSGSRLRVPLRHVHIGEQIIAEAGCPIPADGCIIAGHALIDESFLSGESMPIVKTAGDRVFAGTCVHGDGELRIRVEALQGDTLLSRIAALTRQAQSTKSSIGRKVDRLAAIFVPVMIVLSLSTLLLWLIVLKPGDAGTAAVHALAVLLAACPCALGLAAPISLVLASGRLARRGIVLREAGALERLAQMDMIVLDKTGTLTEGKPSLTEMTASSGAVNALLRAAAAVEAGSQHPFAGAIMEAARLAGIVVPSAVQFHSSPGIGVEAIVEGKHIGIGNIRYGTGQGWEPGRAEQLFAARKESEGETVLYLAIDGECRGAFAFADSLKRSSKEAVAALQAAGVSVLLATGDHSAAAVHTARAAGVVEVYDSMLPEQKAALVRSLQKKGHMVGMAGDGWNDAPALAAADVSFAMGGGTEAALQAGQLTLVRARLTGIVEALLISRLTLRNIRQNLAFAFLYNAIIIPFAAVGGLLPWMAGTAMALSSLSVVGNAIRLNGQLRRAVERREAR
ncbi:Copper-exporting P-type ATPase [Paenibacillus plantiphilus]|uniref:P-type Cu(+) transporter n=1 Tax=Paenibacillus plantiphilus TaxID=2905650 RepID=A0ABN8G5B8_9BACL|nr:Copper-exporting P-type ATPase [Paenibacillus plantiphilus]